MTRPRVVFLHGLSQTILDVVVSHTPVGFDTTAVDASVLDEQQEEAVTEADFIIVFGAELSDRLLRAAGKARLVQLLAAGYDGMDLGLMRELEIPCANNGGANSWAVADHAVLLMLALYKRLLPAERATREGRWKEPIDGMNTFEIAGKLVGILGMGTSGARSPDGYRPSMPRSSTTTSILCPVRRSGSWTLRGRTSTTCSGPPTSFRVIRRLRRRPATSSAGSASP